MMLILENSQEKKNRRQIAVTDRGPVVVEEGEDSQEVLLCIYALSPLSRS